MSLTDKDVNHVARLARLALTDEERVKYRAQLERILESMKSLDKHDTKNTPPTSHVIPVSNVWREDEMVVWEDREAILSNAPDREDVFFKVKKVIEP